jgi:predicted transcriptional regulator of viral defense system
MKNKETLEELARTKFPHKLFVKVDVTNKKREAFIEGYKLAQEQDKNKYS